MGKALVLAGLLLVSAPAQADDLKPYLVLVGGNVADLWTTKKALDSGHAYEGNPIVFKRGVGTITAAKVAGAATMVVIMRLLATHGHPTAAKVFGYVEGGVMCGVAAHNVGASR